MEQVFIWTGFICLMIISITLTFFISVVLVDTALKKSKILDRWFKRFNKWYKSFPKRQHGKRYAVSVYDFELGEFTLSEYLNEYEMKTMIAGKEKST